jgi:YHS domain-containing protein
MKKYAFAIIMCTGLAACGNNETKEQPAEAVETTTVPAGQIDPICKMERDSSWTDYVVNAPGDSTWFCSATCKDAYVAKNK